MDLRRSWGIILKNSTEFLANSFNIMQTMVNTVQKGVLWISRCRSSNDADPTKYSNTDVVATNLKARNRIIKLRVYNNYSYIGKHSQHLLIVKTRVLTTV